MPPTSFQAAYTHCEHSRLSHPGEKSDVDCAQRGTTRTWAATEAMNGREQRAGRQQAKSHGADAGGLETLPDRLINAPHFAISRR